MVVEHLESVSKLHPLEVTTAALYLLAQNTLCRDFHQHQARTITTRWEEEVKCYLDSLLGKNSSPWSNLPADGPSLHPPSGDRDNHHNPGSTEQSAPSPTVIVSSRRFQSHVARHFERLALFALPRLPKKVDRFDTLSLEDQKNGKEKEKA